jgi:hypothetical protein
MKFDLLLTDFRRVRKLLWVGLAYAGVLVGLVLLHSRVSFWVFVALPGILWVLISCWTTLFRRPGWVQVEADGLTWNSPNQEATRSISFAELRAYRFVPNRIGLALRLHLRSGELVGLEGSFNDSFVALWKALDQAVRRYNQAHVGAEILKEKDSLEKFFERPVSTKVLLGLLVLSVAWVVRCLHQEASSLAYLPLLPLLPYLAIWVNFYYERR